MHIRSIAGAAAKVVRRERPRPAVAADARSVRHLGVGDHAATNAGQDRDPVLATVDGAVAGHRIARCCRRGHGDQTLGRPRLLLAGAQPAKGGQADRRRVGRPLPPRLGRRAGVAGSGALHRRRDLQHRVQPTRTDRGRQRRPGADAPAWHRRVAEGQAGR